MLKIQITLDNNDGFYKKSFSTRAVFLNKIDIGFLTHDGSSNIPIMLVTDE